MSEQMKIRQIKRMILHSTPEHRQWAQEYADYWKRTSPFPKKWSKDGQAEFYRRVIIGRLQNRTYKDIAEEDGRSLERIRQIFNRFQRWATKRGYDLKRPLMEKLK